MAEIEHIIEKITKLLALSNRNPSENEAAAALLQAQKLMAKHDISVMDVEALQDMKSKQPIIEAAAEHKWDAAFRKPLAAVIAKNFRTKAWLRGGNVMFYGHETDVVIAKEAFEFAYKFIQRNANKAYEEARAQGRPTHGIANTYALGFISGIEDALSEQCRALMLVIPTDVEEEYVSRSAKFSEDNRTMRYRSDAAVHRKGYQDGYDAFAQRKLSSKG